jgi:hypothetical protein
LKREGFPLRRQDFLQDGKSAVVLPRPRRRRLDRRRLDRRRLDRRRLDRRRLDRRRLDRWIRSVE